jgi:hypothetical protein
VARSCATTATAAVPVYHSTIRYTAKKGTIENEFI